MKIGITICAIILIQLIYIEFGGIINDCYLTGCFIGGVIIAFIERFVFGRKIRIKLNTNKEVKKYDKRNI